MRAFWQALRLVNGTPLRILICEDDERLAALVAETLEADGRFLVVARATDGDEAVRLTQAHAPDVVLMDIGMPDMNGVEATAQLVAKLPSVRIIVLSMHGDAEHVQRALKGGAAGYLLKESAAAEVVAAVRAVHLGREYFSPAVVRHARRRAAGTPLERLSSRERQVLQLVAEGRTSAEIAALVHLSPKSIDTYRSRLMRKLGVEDIAALVKFAIRHGITPPG